MVATKSVASQPVTTLIISPPTTRATSHIPLATAMNAILTAEAPEAGPFSTVSAIAGRRFKAYRCDFSDRKALYEFIRCVTEDLPRIDILVNNAGAILRAPAHQYPDEYWDPILEVNLTSQFILAREIGKRMLERGRGKVIFVASMLSFQGGITVPAYAASKGGVAQLTRAFANEWAGRGVNVNAIAPGYFRTDVTVDLERDPKRGPAILERIPAGRWGRPEDLAGTVVYLASAASDYLHGSIVVVDGGWLSR